MLDYQYAVVSTFEYRPTSLCQSVSIRTIVSSASASTIQRTRFVSFIKNSNGSRLWNSLGGLFKVSVIFDRFWPTPNLDNVVFADEDAAVTKLTFAFGTWFVLRLEIKYVITNSTRQSYFWKSNTLSATQILHISWNANVYYCLQNSRQPTAICSFNWINQPYAATSQVYYLSFN